MVERDYNFTESITYGVGSGIGWALAITALAGIREKLKYKSIEIRYPELLDQCEALARHGSPLSCHRPQIQRLRLHLRKRPQELPSIHSRRLHVSQKGSGERYRI